MAVTLRLMRIGRKGQPYYRIVAVDSRKRRDGAYIEKIGQYNPLARPAEVLVDDEKALKWLSRGAQPSDTVRNLFSRLGIMMAFDLQKKGLKEEEIRDKVARFRFEKDEKLKALEDEAIKAQAKKLTTTPSAITDTPEETPAEPVETKPAEEAAVEETVEVESEVQETKAEATTEEVEEEKVEAAAEEEPEKKGGESEENSEATEESPSEEGEK